MSGTSLRLTASTTTLMPPRRLGVRLIRQSRKTKMAMKTNASMTMILRMSSNSQ